MPQQDSLQLQKTRLVFVEIRWNALLSATCAFEGMLLHVLLLQQQCRGSGVYSLSFPRSLLARGGDEICSGNSI